MKIAMSIQGYWHGDQVIDDMNEELQESFTRAARRIEADAKSLVHVGPGDPMHLKDTIRSFPAVQEKWKPGAFVFAGDRDKGVYWHFMLEFGTYESDAHPFLRPAADKNFNPALAEARHTAQRVINRKRRITDKSRRIESGKKR